MTLQTSVKSCFFRFILAQRQIQKNCSIFVNFLLLLQIPFTAVVVYQVNAVECVFEIYAIFNRKVSPMCRPMGTEKGRKNDDFLEIFVFEA